MSRVKIVKTHHKVMYWAWYSLFVANLIAFAVAMFIKAVASEWICIMFGVAVVIWSFLLRRIHKDGIEYGIIKKS